MKIKLIFKSIYVSLISLLYVMVNKVLTLLTKEKPSILDNQSAYNTIEKGNYIGYQLPNKDVWISEKYASGKDNYTSKVSN